MAWAYKASSYADQGTAGYAGPANGGTSTLTLGAAVAIGDLIVVGIIGGNTNTTDIPNFTFADNVNSGAYTQATTVSGWSYPGTSNQNRVSLFYKVATAAGTPTITATFSLAGGNAFGGMAAVAYTGLASTSTLDVATSAGQPSGTAASSGATAATGGASELVVGFNADLGEGTPTIAAGSGFTLRGAHQNDGGHYEAALEDQTSGASGSTATATFTRATSTPSGTAVAVFKLAAGGTVNYPITVSCTQSQTLSLAKAGNRTLSIAQPQTVSVRKAVNRAVALAQTQTVSLARTASLHLTRSVIEATFTNLSQGRVLQRTVTASQGQTLAVTIQNVLPRTVSLTQTQTVLLVKAVRRTLSITQSQTALQTFLQSLHRTLSLAQGQIATLIHSGTLPKDFYTTNFPLTENPISESGVWTAGSTDGFNTNVASTPAKAFGTETGTGGFDDSLAFLRGTFGNNQQAQATVFNLTGAGGSWSTEVELLLRTTVTAPNGYTGYEINFSTNATNGYTSVVRIDGATFSQLPSAAIPSVKTGDVVKATISGPTITVFVNSTQVLQVTDATYTSGNPGIGFYNADSGGHTASSNFGMSSFTAQTIGGTFSLSRVVVETTAITLGKAVRETVVIAQSEAVSVRQTGQRTLVLAQAQLLSLTRQIRLPRAVTQTESASVVVLKVLPRTVQAVQTQAVSLVRQARLTRNAAQAQVLTLGQAGVRTLLLLEPTQAILGKAVRMMRALTESQAAVLTINVGVHQFQLTVSAHVGEVATIGVAQRAGITKVFTIGKRELTFTARSRS